MQQRKNKKNGTQPQSFAHYPNKLYWNGSALFVIGDHHIPQDQNMHYQENWLFVVLFIFFYSLFCVC